MHLFKNVFQRLRPCHNPQIADWVHIVNNKCGGQFGFVSSHAANVFAFATYSPASKSGTTSDHRPVEKSEVASKDSE